MGKKLTVEEINEHSKNPNQGFDNCSICNGVELAGSMNEVNKESFDLICSECVERAKLQAFFEEQGFQVHLFEQDNEQNAEVESWSDGGVDMIINLLPFTKEEFIKYVNDFDIDEEIMLNRQDKRYCADFTLTQSLKDFKKYHTGLKKVSTKLKKL